MKSVYFFVTASVLSASASAFRTNRALMQLDCDKDCSDLSTTSAILCEMSKYGGCAYSKIVDGGGYVVGHVQGWFQSSSDSESNAGNVTTSDNSTGSGSNQTHVGNETSSTEAPTNVNQETNSTTAPVNHEHHHGSGNHNHTHAHHNHD